MRSLSLLSIVLASRAALAGDEPLKTVFVGEIYYNVATGEQIVTPIGATPRNTSGHIWFNAAPPPCFIDFLYIDNPDFNNDSLPDYTGRGAIPAELNAPPEGAWLVDWGDLRFDAVVDCVRIAYVTSVPDTDTNGDLIGDGVDGFDMTISFADADNGHDSDRVCIYDLTLESLPGATSAVPPGYTTSYVLTLDFASLAPSQIFELGDSDNVDQAGTGFSGGAIYGSPTGADLDADGRNDFSIGISFDQSTIPLAQRGLAGVQLNMPEIEDAPGAEDALDLYASGPSCPPAGAPYLGTFNLGGFTCEPGFERPFASIWYALYGPDSVVNPCRYSGGCSDADLAFPGGVISIDDVLAFLVYFSEQDACADYAPPIGQWDINDVLAYLVLFSQGCF
ncbi:MAG: GC-type dockerin domain-anchored protein [Phycisphaerales bacterium]